MKPKRSLSFKLPPSLTSFKVSAFNPGLYTTPLVIAGLLALSILLFKAGQEVEWSGFGADEAVSTSVKTDSQGKVETTKTTTPQSGKTLWDILSLIGVPASLALLGWWLQVQQQRQSDVVLREEALKEFIDAIAALLIEKNLIAIATKVKAEEESATKAKAEKKSQSEPQATATALEVSEPDVDLKAVVNESSTGTVGEPPKVVVTDEQRELLAAATDVIQARTLSILRRLGDDAERKSAVIQFLAEADLIEKVGLDLSGFDLKGIGLFGANLRGIILAKATLNGADLTNAKLNNANLEGANLEDVYLYKAIINYADLSKANLSGAHLELADLIDAHLEGAHLTNAHLEDANLSNAHLELANLSNANLSNADLSNADLSYAQGLTEEQLSKALLCNTTLPPEFQYLSDRDCETLKRLEEAMRSPLPQSPPQPPSITT
jgi:uncharacterized protein YjbI with pentapeptide repeats